MPAVQVKIDRDRAAALGVTPQQIETALGAAFGGQQISQIYAAVRPVSGDPGTAAAISAAMPQRSARGSTSPASTAATLVPLNAVTTIDRRHHAAQRQSSGPGSRRHHLLRPGARQGADAMR